MFNSDDIVHGIRCFQVSVKGIHSWTQCRVATLRVKRHSTNGRQGKVEGVSARWRKRKNRSYRWVATTWSRSRETFKEHARRIIPHLIDTLAKHHPIVIDANSTAHTPGASLGRIPGKANSRTPQIALGVCKD